MVLLLLLRQLLWPERQAQTELMALMELMAIFFPLMVEQVSPAVTAVTAVTVMPDKMALMAPMVQPVFI